MVTEEEVQQSVSLTRYTYHSPKLLPSARAEPLPEPSALLPAAAEAKLPESVEGMFVTKVYVEVVGMGILRCSG